MLLVENIEACVNMKEQILTLVAANNGGLGAGHVSRALEIAGKAAKGVPDWLSRGRAVDIELSGEGAVPTIEFPEVDTFIQPKEGRRKRLLLADMDSTMIRQETLDEIAGLLGIKDKVAPITERAMRGELDFGQALAQRVALLKGVPFARAREVLTLIEFMPGAVELIATMNRHGGRCVLVSGGFDFVTQWVAEKLGFAAHFSNHLDDEGGILCGTVSAPILDRERKREILQEQRRTLALGDHDVFAIGDGANDIPMLQEAGAGMAFHAKPMVQASVRHKINHGDLRTALYFMGYRDAEIVPASA